MNPLAIAIGKALQVNPLIAPHQLSLAGNLFSGRPQFQQDFPQAQPPNPQRPSFKFFNAPQDDPFGENWYIPQMGVPLQNNAKMFGLKSSGNWLPYYKDTPQGTVLSVPLNPADRNTQWHDLPINTKGQILPGAGQGFDEPRALYPQFMNNSNYRLSNPLQ